ncbi:MAG TPA: MFS transporter [Caulobacteraceae bacterium]|nr:MFS transporter [Caulobacteraceae bacterium]
MSGREGSGEGVPAAAAGIGWADLLAEGRGARVAVICLGVWLNAADSLVTATIMPTIGRDLGGFVYFSWATAAYMAGAILSGATAARLSARLGLRTAMVAAGIFTAAGCAVSALAPAMIAFVVGRAVQGVGAGWIVGACYAAIGAMFPQRHLARIFGLMTGVWGVATVFGPLVGGVFAQGGGVWRWLFWAFGVQALAFSGAVMWLLPGGAAPADNRAPWGQLALVMLGVALTAAADLTGSALVAGLLCAASLGVFIAAVRIPVSARDSLFPRAAGDPASVIGAGYVSYFGFTAAATGFSVYGPAILQALEGLTPLESGYAAGLESVGWTAAALTVAGLAPAWHGPILRLGAAAIVLSLAAFAWVMRFGPLWQILAAAVVLGAGFGLTSGFTGRRVIASAGEEAERELASAGINSVRQVGSAAGACLAGIVANLLGMTAGVTRVAAEGSAVWLFVVAAPIALVGAAGCWRVAAAEIEGV